MGGRGSFAHVRRPKEPHPYDDLVSITNFFKDLEPLGTLCKPSLCHLVVETRVFPAGGELFFDTGRKGEGLIFEWHLLKSKKKQLGVLERRQELQMQGQPYLND